MSLPDRDLIFEDATSSRRDALCVACKGSKMFCGKRSCPVVTRFYAKARTQPLIDTLHLEGASPPSIFVGRMGYPKVFVGPMVPPTHGDTSILDSPELWGGAGIEDIVNYRMQLVRGMYKTNVYDANCGGRIVDMTREISLCRESPETEALFTKKPTGRLVLDDSVQPMGPSAPLKNMDLGTLKIDHRLDRAYSDGDLKAAEAVVSLHDQRIPVTRINRAFSAGAFGIEKNRRFVPTRWSITAVDDIVGKELREEVKNYPLINEFRIYESWRLDNRFLILMMPMSWKYELMEAWYPDTVWNPRGKRIVIYSSHEGYKGRTKYAEIGGCYYAARLAVGEHLTGIRRQAAICIMREAHPGYIMPVGVWNVRENVRNALSEDPKKFDTLKEALDYSSTRMAIPTSRWIKNSSLLKDALYQKRLEDFLVT
ncbi:MAG: Nre family DNA repair protein [Candidatus Thorarchaeota archaeon]